MAALESTRIGRTGQNLGFLLALPRSGSTLLSAILDNHPEIASPPEPWVMLALHSLGQVDRRHPADSRLVGTALDLFAGEEGLRSAARAAAATLYGMALQGSGKTFFLDKTPRYHLILDYLNDVFPDAKLVWLRRNPFAIAASYRSTWGFDLPALLRSGDDHPAVFDLLTGLGALERFSTALGDRVHVVHYERLIADPIAALHALLMHLGLPSPEESVRAMTDLTALGRSKKQFGDHKILKTTAPHADSLDRWKSELSVPDLQTLLDALGRDRLTRLGYGAAVEEVLALGAVDKGPDVTLAHEERCRRLMDRRLSDLGRASAYEGVIPTVGRWGGLPPGTG
ncbi:sulfotransferase [Azospirillum sp. SYSU D00513]|uniref:sulfotransferase n=1 Tax=Azospirillum sp. SYSU D00513 TaxID=2812561 RepID=UPI001A95BB5F